MLTKSAYNEKAFTKNMVFTKSARDAWKLILNTVKSKKGFANILLPSYIGVTDREGSGIFDPVEVTESKYSFYKLKEDLSVDYDHLQLLAQTGVYNVLLVVHYFGFCRNNLNRMKQIYDIHKILFVED